LLIDSTIIRAHQHAAGAEGSTAEDEAWGRSRGGFSTTIHVAVDGLGNPVRIVLSPGQAGDITFAPELVAGLEAEAVVGDKGYDSDAVVKSIAASGAQAVKKNRVGKRE
jgi:IS5 family transposase